jgi:hypothetical protein
VKIDIDKGRNIHEPLIINTTAMRAKPIKIFFFDKELACSLINWIIQAFIIFNNFKLPNYIDFLGRKF